MKFVKVFSLASLLLYGNHMLVSLEKWAVCKHVGNPNCIFLKCRLKIFRDICDLYTEESQSARLSNTDIVTR